MIYCQKRGVQNSDSNQFCSACGEKLTNSESEKNSNQTMVEPQKKYTVGRAIGKACIWFFLTPIAIAWLMAIIGTIVAVVQANVGSDLKTLNTILFDLQILLILSSMLIIAPITLIKGIIKASKNENGEIKWINFII